jgi:tRNA G10  N-methylase Trm11
MGALRQETLESLVGTANSTYSWDFARADTQYATHGLHPYPARMLPQIASRLIKSFSIANETVLDPFCGSGGVLVEARLNSRNSIGVDINPLALFLAKVKTTPIKSVILRRSWRKLKRSVTAEIKQLRQCREFNPPQFPENLHLEYWFKPKVINELSIIRRNIQEIKDHDIQDFFLATFSATVRFVSNNRPNEYKLYRLSKEDLEKYDPDVLRKFISHTEKCINGIINFSQQCDKQAFIELKLEDTRHLSLPDEDVDLIVTSPPYGDSHTTVGYGQFSKYMLIWLCFDGYSIKKLPRFDWEKAREIDFKLSLGGEVFGDVTIEIEKIINESEALNKIIDEIGKRENELKVRQSRIPSLVRFFYDLKLCLQQMFRVLKPGGYSCIVIGNRSIRGIRIPTDKIISELSGRCGFETEKFIFRNIPSKRHPISQKWMVSGVPQAWINNIVKESIVVLKK